MATRRAFLAGLASGLSAASLPRVSWAEVGSPAFLAAGKLGDDFVLHGLSAAGDSLFEIGLPARGHAAAAHPSQALAVAFARRPGTFALVLDCLTGVTRHRLTPPEGRQFNGHGAFSMDGSLLMTSEVVAEGSAGRIGLWETAAFTRIAEWDSHGIGPHDIRRLADGRIVVANGGIETDPGDRTKLNVDVMRPNLSLLSPEGALLDQVELEDALHQNSIRHLALLGDGVAFAMQWEGDPFEPVAQLGLWVPGAAPVLCPPPDDQAYAMKGYAGSIAVSSASDLIALTSAPAGVVMLFNGAGQWLATDQRADVSGAAAVGDDLRLTDGQGGVWGYGHAGLMPLSRNATLWDNHLIALA
ncbi:hypothetical protein GCM10010873_08610 [Cypionkella aquatica]|uniref:DUF1513 domain-containing protein n=1 Tax=Cypionkella aquatica TaxID=1756042 RepID=A0AA37TWC6_9RHOB|nr:DUF1513 domain-containing protein [Cypionkella aquatica]GLS85887.1 hypothetical protein GCM10010873_08610 [Cypionkella aquatica]